MSEEKYVIVVNTPEEVAYKLMLKILSNNPAKTPSEQDVLDLYQKCLKTVKQE